MFSWSSGPVSNVIFLGVKHPIYFELLSSLGLDGPQRSKCSIVSILIQKRRKIWIDRRKRLCLVFKQENVKNRKLQEETGDCNTLCKLWAQGQSPVKFVPWASAGHARNSDAILGKVQLASFLWLWPLADRIKGLTQLVQYAGQWCLA